MVPVKAMPAVRMLWAVGMYMVARLDVKIGVSRM